MMKKWMRVWICLIAFTVLMVTAAAAVDLQRYTLDELGLSVDIPTDLIVFTRDIDPQDPNLAWYGVDAATATEYFEANDIYLSATDENYEFDIGVSMVTNDNTQMVENFNLCSDLEVQEMGELLAGFYEENDRANVNAGLYHHEQAIFMVLSFEDVFEDGTVGSLQYYTIWDGNAVVFTLYSYEGEVSTDMEACLLSIVDSADFGADESSTESAVVSAVNDAVGLPANASSSALYKTLIVSIIFTICLYSVPILIYRYAVKKEALPRPKARKITIIYGIFALIMAVMIGALAGDTSPGGAVFLWSFVNYRILIGGKPKAMPPRIDRASDGPNAFVAEAAAEHIPVFAPAYNDPTETLCCSACGAVLSQGSIFCDQCGTRVEREGGDMI